MQAGACGLFSQPFFDMRFLEMYADLLEGIDVYWGVSPVLSARSKGYWERKDRAVFPKDFEPTMKWNVEFSHKVIDFISSTTGGLYFMPITIDIADFLPQIF
jgi:methylenetetrahydrofolate reductase (NADPH)